MAAFSDRAKVRTLPRLLAGVVGVCISGSALTGAVSAAAIHSTRKQPSSRAAATTTSQGRNLSSKPAATHEVPFLVFGDYEGRRPRGISFSGDAGDIVENLKWTTWTRSHATGSGTSYLQGCIPDCATGAEILVPTLITLRDPVAGTFTQIIERRDGQNYTFIYTRPPTRGRYPEIQRGPGLAGPAVSLEDYWGDIETGAYAKAWTYVAAAGDSQAAFVQNEQEARPTDIQLFGTLLGITGDRARIALKRLRTHDDQYGCRSWSGYYEMVVTNGKWLVDGAHIAPTPCR